MDLATKMMPSEIVLLGADFAFVGNKAHIFLDHYDQYLTKHSEIDIGFNNQHWVLDSLGNKIPSIASFKGYLRELELFIELHPQNLFFNASNHGAKIKGAKPWIH